MTTSGATEVFLAVSAELSRETPAHERFQRLLQGLRQVFPCDAAALLQLHESTLIPLAADGLSPDTLAALAAAVRDVTKLRADVTVVPPGGLPNDGKVIEDARSYA